jgi:predicted site-specific integrase-resolvase
MSPKEVAERYSITENTLTRWRKSGIGPQFIKYGKQAGCRVRYLTKTVLEFELKYTIKPSRREENGR